ncbi:hypothetical protein K0M31_016162 [Melipona bicolor]|uniref:Uncharacterized protein n=1 Tax=Melipona bicolor TaxID=60889 RepID=A0AA40G6M5_9HYME|nr:hypothetical protein K0M31_016162 [Melipona bicolor]
MNVSEIEYMRRRLKLAEKEKASVERELDAAQQQIEQLREMQRSSIYRDPERGATVQRVPPDVLRELGQKKPQLDELVHTAEALCADTNREQVHSKVTKLKEHWDKMNPKMMQRKTGLDAMLGDSQRYEAEKNEVEVWW